jgi:glycosyltransferase involved in cell wall biosynthesis
MGARVIHNPRGRGPAAARNVGAENAKGEILFFVDSDVVIQPNALSEVYKSFQSNPQLAALFGSYDLSPAETNFLSQFKNLFHHFIHQTGSENASTFWAGCGAIRAEAFRDVGGFNEHEFRRPSIEDIELGLRLCKKHHPIRLEKTLQAKHLKHWNWSNLLRADILDRAYPWSRLIMRSGTFPDDLNLIGTYRLSAVLVGILFALLLLTIGSIWIITLPQRFFLAAILTIFGLLMILNRPLYSFFLKHRGWKFTTGAIFCHLFYYLYSGFTFLYCWLRFKVFVFRGSLREAEHVVG